MTNVIPFAARADAGRADAGRADAAVAIARTTVSVVADLVSTVEQIREISERVLPLPLRARG